MKDKTECVSFLFCLHEKQIELNYYSSIMYCCKWNQ